MKLRHDWLVLVLLWAAPPAVAGDDATGEVCKEAQRLAQEGKAEEAAKVYGEALARAQSKGDLVAECTLAESMRSAGWGEHEGVALSRVLAELDAKHNGACVSRASCAAELVLHATRTGDRTHVDVASGILSEHANRGRTGACAKVLADYAAGLAAASAGNAANAAGHLDRALDEAVRERWADLAIHIGCERAALALQQHDEATAKAAMEKIASAVPDATDRTLAMVWRRIVQKRLGDAPEEVLAPWVQATGGHVSPGGSASAGGGAGGAGAPGGSGRAKTPLESLYEKPAARALFGVERSRDGMKVTHAFDKGFSFRQEPQPHIRHHSAAGVHLAFWSGGVALLMLDPTGRHGAPGESAGDVLPPSFLGLHRLAVGETLTVTRGGVTIR